MVLVDTSVWIEHFRRGHPLLVTLLENAKVMSCPFIVGELALGNIKNRAEILGLLSTLPKCQTASHEEVMFLIERDKLTGAGIGYIDANLLAAASISGVPILTLDKNLLKAAKRLGLDYGKA